MDQEPGLRERKKQRTRQLIADTARRLFAERGFDAVPVAAVARAAEVSEATVFNYFPTKEDLVYQNMEAFEAELLTALRNRPAGEPIATAFGQFVLRPRGLLAAEDQAAVRYLTAVSKMIASSPTLLAREQQIFACYTASLAALIAEDTGAEAGDLRPWAAAHALMGIHQALIDLVRRRLTEGPVDQARLVHEVAARGRQALDLLAVGLGSYGVRPAGTATLTSSSSGPARAG
jgi:AcrR family transcriptional regulator